MSDEKHGPVGETLDEKAARWDAKAARADRKPLDLDALEALANAATAGEVCENCEHTAYHCLASGCNEGACDCEEYEPRDQDDVDVYTDAARAALPALIAEVRRLREEGDVMDQAHWKELADERAAHAETRKERDEAVKQAAKSEARLVAMGLPPTPEETTLYTKLFDEQKAHAETRAEVRRLREELDDMRATACEWKQETSDAERLAYAERAAHAETRAELDRLREALRECLAALRNEPMATAKAIAALAAGKDGGT